MKFLVFNGIVVAALYYLVTGGFDPAPGIRALQPVQTAITGALSDSGALPRAAAPAVPVVVQAEPVEAPAPAAPRQPTRAVVANPPAPVASPVRVEERAPLREVVVAARPEPVPAPPRTVETAWIDTDDEDLRNRRAEVLGEPAPATQDAQQEPAFMTPRERLAELQRLSEEMELFFVEKTVQ